MPAFVYLGGEQGRGSLKSVLAAPMQTMDGRYLARTVFDKAAILYRSIVKNHATVDGNKRLGLSAAMVFLNANGYMFWAPRHEAVDFTLKMAATHGNPEVNEIASWLRRRSLSFRRFRAMSKPERRQFRRHVRLSLTYRQMESLAKVAIQLEGAT